MSQAIYPEPERSIEKTRFKHPSKSHQGYGCANGHNGELLQGVFENQRGGLSRGLITLPCKNFKSEAIFYRDENPSLVIEPSGKTKVKRAAELTLEHLDQEQRGYLKINSNIPNSLGLGSSTSDVTAAILAIGDYFNQNLSPEVISHIAVAAETASDSIMFNGSAILFAHREGMIIEDFGGSIPPIDVLCFNTNVSDRGVDTLTLQPARYSCWEIEKFRVLRSAIRRAIADQDPYLIGQVASASSRINQRYLLKPKFNDLEKITQQVEGAGLQVAHSGTVAGLIFDSADKNIQKKIQSAQELLAEIGFTQTWFSSEYMEVMAA